MIFTNKNYLYIHRKNIMFNKVILGLVWFTIFMIFSLIISIVQKYLTKVFNNKKQQIELNKKKYPEKSFSMEENINNNLLKSYINNLSFFKWFVLIMAILVFLRVYFSQHFDNP